MFNEATGIFFAGVVLGGVIFGLVGLAYGWDYGLIAGRKEREKHRDDRSSAADSARHDLIEHLRKRGAL